MSKCIGCGIKLQSENKDKLGYTANLKNSYCERCFKTIHYNEEKKIKAKDNYKIIDKINLLGYFTIFLTDLLNINEKTMDIYNMINNKKILVVNKEDIIPKNLKIAYLKENLKNIYNIDDILFISAKKQKKLKNLANIIKKEENIILCGETSSGKSTLINNLTNSSLTTSKYDNTTLDFIKIKFADAIIYDTPGLVLNNKKSFNNIQVKAKKLNSDFILNIDDVKLRIDGNVTIFVSDDTSISSKKSAEALDVKINVNSDTDVLLPGGGFIFCKNKCSIKSNKKLIVRNSIIGR